jgi:hypothetical protein
MTRLLVHCCRALIALGSVKPADTNPHTLGVKRTAGFVRACNEMLRHQELVQRAAQFGFEKTTGHRSDSEEKEVHDINTDHNGSKVRISMVLEMQIVLRLILRLWCIT